MTIALVVGSASCLWDDVSAAKSLCKFDAVYCVNETGIQWPEAFDVWATLHPEFMGDYKAQRASRGLPNGYQVVAPPDKELGTVGKNLKADRRISYLYPGMNSSASSGGYAAKVALEDGHDRVVLAGVPMNNSEHFRRGEAWSQCGAFTIGFEQSVPFFAGRVRSMSGRSKELLGAPSAGWLTEAQHQ